MSDQRKVQGTDPFPYLRWRHTGDIPINCRLFLLTVGQLGHQAAVISLLEEIQHDRGAIFRTKSATRFLLFAA